MIDVQITLCFLALLATVFMGIATASTMPILLRRAAWLFITAITISAVYAYYRSWSSGPAELQATALPVVTPAAHQRPAVTPAQSISPPGSPHAPVTPGLEPASAPNQAHALSRSSSVATNPDLERGSIVGTLTWTLVIGLIIGVVARLIMPGSDPGGCIITMLIGISGAFVASSLGQKIGWYERGQPASFISSVVGALLLLLLYRLIYGRRPS